MTISEYTQKEEELKQNTLGKSIEYDGNGNFQCWDLAQVYFVNYLGVPEGVLGGCNYVWSMLYPPKKEQLLKYFNEVNVHNMIKGDTVIWDRGNVAPDGHIAVYDHFDGQYCWFVTQNGPVPHLTTLSILEVDAGARAFRLKSVEPDKKVKLRGHIQDIGWTNWQDNVIGTTGQNKRLEAIQIDAPEYKIQVRAMIQDKGWVDYGTITKDTIIGTTGESKRIEELQIIADGLEYQVHIQDLGWSNVTPCKKEYSLGTSGYCKGLEALCIR